ncbi:glycoside hydrolase family 20 zincin-like fold domain-containing protein [Allorhizocola rhizosphaerae]|uniref:glycoside hydrolase family 20 zincin-like fold domain-containing protein n=1 Tax=Allorhizocola rhizosphaerae TaxID=1872709 RepID=UPI0013C2E1A4|nr:glycoside hydrolase family 20 zincin-like fold domain-containing protein [Allorhizocola rhizosphaerae]
MHRTTPAVPQEIIVHRGQHFLTQQTRVCAKPELAALIRVALRRAGLPLPDAPAPGEGVIAFALGGDARLGTSGYRMLITEKTVDARALTDDGLRRAVETLRLLMHAQTGHFGQTQGWQLPCVEITERER